MAGHRAPGHRPAEPVVHRRRAGGGPGEHPRRPPRRAGRVLGAHQLHLVGPARRSGRPPASVGPAPYLSFVKTQCAGMTGLADTMMSRDQTWLFFTLGRCLERRHKRLPPSLFPADRVDQT